MIFTGCSTHHRDTSHFILPEDYIGDAVKITSIPLETEYIAENNFLCHYTESGFLGRMNHENKKMVHLADLDNGEIKVSACALGRGPDELLSAGPESDLFDNKLYLLDQIADKIIKVEIQQDTLITYPVMKLQPNTLMAFSDIEVISDSVFVLFASDSDYLQSIQIWDNKNRILDSLSYVPLESEKFNQVYRFNINMGLSPCKEYLFISCNQYDCLSKYHIKENKINKGCKIFLTEPLFSANKGKPEKDEEYIRTNLATYVGEKYVYVTVQPELMKDYRARHKKAQEEGRGRHERNEPGNSSYILVFDYGLNLIKTYLTDSDIYNLATTPDPATVYATDWKDNRLVKYDLPGLY